PECAALRREADPAGRERARGERRVQTGGRGRDPEAVRPDEAGPVRADEREQALLPLAALGAGLGEAGRDDAPRPDPLPERGHRDVVPLLDPRAEALRGGDREAQLDLAAAQLAHDLESCVAEDAERRTVVGHHVRDEALDPRLAGAGGELLEEPGSNPPALL